jgi:hypothetical protein
MNVQAKVSLKRFPNRLVDEPITVCLNYDDCLSEDAIENRLGPKRRTI